jgi:hypothetical protein
LKKITAEVLPLGSMTKTAIAKFVDWVWQMRHLNLFDKDVLTYPRTVMCRAGNEDDDLLFVPVQSVLMFDSLAPKPGLTPRQEAMCLWRVGEAVDEIAKQTGHREVYFFCSDDRVADICSRHGFKEIKGVRLMRKKLPCS